MGRILFAAVMLSCSTRDPTSGTRFVCGDVSTTCFGVVHESYYATSASRTQTALELLALPGASLDETNTDATVIAIDWRDAKILVYAPADASDWFHASCTASEGETIIDVAYATR